MCHTMPNTQSTRVRIAVAITCKGCLMSIVAVIYLSFVDFHYLFYSPEKGLSECRLIHCSVFCPSAVLPYQKCFQNIGEVKLPTQQGYSTAEIGVVVHLLGYPILFLSVQLAIVVQFQTEVVNLAPLQIF